jgi:hypothetical protein
MSILNNSISLTKRGFLLNAILFAVFFIFYFIFSVNVLPQVLNQSDGPLSLARVVFICSIVGSLLVSSFFRHKLMNLKIVFVSTAMTALFTSFLLVVSSFVLILIVIFLVGIFFSIGQLAFYVHFWNTTSSEERGRIGGLIGFATLPFYFIISIVATSTLSSSSTIIIAVTLCLIPVVALSTRHKKICLSPDKDNIYPERRTVILYSIPWIIFSLINATLAKNVALNLTQSISPSLFEVLFLLQIIAALVGVLIGGFAADFFGRRLCLALSVTLSGSSMALYGLIQPQSSLYYFAFLADGFSWGILLTMYSFVIWGDLSSKDNCAKMYAIGLVVFYIAAGVGEIPIGISQISAVASAFLGCTLIFFLNVPIALAPELQSSDFREKIRLKMHIKAAKKAAKELENQG